MANATKHLSFAEAAKACWNHIADAQGRLLLDPSDQAVATGLAVTCSKGCGACCHYGLISSSSIEAFGVVVAWVGQAKPLGELARLCDEYVRGYRSFIERNGHAPFSLTARRKFMLEKLPCPLFIKGSEPWQGHCGFYEHRPLICSYFHSLDVPSKCSLILPHSLEPGVVQSGDQEAEFLRDVERQTFGKSALGHLPLLIAALTTAEGMSAFLRVEDRESVSNPDDQSLFDFYFLEELYAAVGIELGKSDYEDLGRSQKEEAGF